MQVLKSSIPRTEPDLFSDTHLFSDTQSKPTALERTPSEKSKYYQAFKRVADLFGAALLLVLTFPLILLTTIAVLVTSRGPVIFKQKRLTFRGKEFTMYKFRTMRVDAESETGPVWASSKDPRVTPIGQFLRRYRLDELPQLVNVLKGEMSLIGPRPERPELVASLKESLPSFERRFETKAGITGLAQVSSGYADCLESYQKKLALDILYVKKCCLLLDLTIALKTITVILRGYGAR